MNKLEELLEQKKQIVFNEAAGYSGYGYMSPYYSTNGNLCKYDMNSYSIVEIEN